MNDSSNLSWLDADVLKGLATAAGLSSGKSAARARSVPAPPAAKGKARNIASPMTATALRRNFNAQTSETGSSTIAQEPSRLPPFHAPQSAAMGQRLNAFIDWLFRNLPCQRVFIADGDGLPLAQRHSNIDLIGISTVLMDASKQLRGHLQLHEEGVISMELGENELFLLVQLQMPWQQVSLGIIVRGALGQGVMDQVKAALRFALELEPDSATSIHAAASQTELGGESSDAGEMSAAQSAEVRVAFPMGVEQSEQPTDSAPLPPENEELWPS